MRGKEIEEYYFFFNEPLNGVIKSQVIDRIKDQKENGKEIGRASCRERV